MNRIIKPRATGKTTEVVKLAHENNAIVVCANPKFIWQRAQELGYENTIKAISYNEFLYFWHNYNEPFIIDEIDGFLLHCFNNNVIGYSLSEED